MKLKLNPPAPRESIEELERALGVLLPEEYVKFLLRHNGGPVFMQEPGFDVKYNNGFVGETIMTRFFAVSSPEMGNDLLHIYRSYEEAERMPGNFLPAGYDFAGSMVGIIISGENYGKVYYWDHEKETTEEAGLNYLADNMDLFLASLKRLVEYDPSSMERCFHSFQEAGDIESFEKDFHMEIPDEYRKFLLQINGGEPKNRYFHTMDNKTMSLVSMFFPLYGNGDDNLHDEFLGITMQGETPPNIMSIASTPSGNRVVMSFEGDDKGAIYYWSWDAEPEPSSGSYKYMSKISDSFYDFFTNLTRDRQLPG